MEKIVEQGLLYDFYGELLTEHQRQIYESCVFDNLSLGEIAQDFGISRQGVHDNLNRTEAMLRKMEEKTGCVRRDLSCRRASKKILHAASLLAQHTDRNVSALASEIISAAEALGE